MAIKVSKKRLSTIAIAVLIIFPFVNPDPFTLFIFTVALLWAIVALNLNILIGYGGIFFISPMIFVAVAGYASAWLSLPTGAPTCPAHEGCLGLHPFQSILIGATLAAIFSFAFSLLSTRLRGLYMALYSLVFTLFLGTVAVQSHPAIFYWTGGPNGMGQLPDIVVGGFEFRSLNGIAYYYLELTILIISALVLTALLKSRIGLALRTLRDAETYSTILGVNPLKIKVYVFAITAFFMGIAGGVWVHFFSSIQVAGTAGGAVGGPWSPSWINFFLIILVYGGLGTFVGPVVGSFILVLLEQNLKIYGAWGPVIIAATVIGVLLITPEGVVGRIQNYFAAKRGEHPITIPRVLLEKAKGK